MKRIILLIGIKDLFFKISLETIYLHLRRNFYYHFKRKEMMDSIAKRKGYCNYKKCGQICCGYYPCECLDNNLECKINEDKPIMCRLFPFDEQDKSTRLKSVCAYYW